MAKFKVMYLDDQKIIHTQVPGRVIKKNITITNVRAYGHENIKVGDVLEINGPLADKARRNPMFREVSGKDA